MADNANKHELPKIASAVVKLAARPSERQEWLEDWQGQYSSKSEKLGVRWANMWLAYEVARSVGFVLVRQCGLNLVVRWLIGS